MNKLRLTVATSLVFLGTTMATYASVMDWFKQAACWAAGWCGVKW